MTGEMSPIPILKQRPPQRRSTIRLRKIVVVLLLAAPAFALAALRRPEAILTAEPFAESAPVFYLPTFFADPLTLLFTPYAGYLHVATRLIAEAQHLVDPTFAPVVATVLSIAITVGVAGFLASPRMESILPGAWQRYAFATALLLAPAVYEVLGIDIAIYIYLAVYLVALAVAIPPTSQLGRLMDVGGAVLAGLTGPFSLLFAPLFVARRHRLSAVIAACATIQLFFLITSPGREWAAPAVSTIVESAALRINVAVLGSLVGAIAPPQAAVVVGLALGFVAVKGAPVRAWGPFAYAALVVAGAGIAVTGPAIADGVVAGERYFVLGSMTAALIVIVGIASESQAARATARVLGALIVAGYLLGFRVPPFQDGTWPQRSACIGSATPCFLPVVPSRFSVQWPGTSGSYAPPTSWPRH